VSENLGTWNRIYQHRWTRIYFFAIWSVDPSSSRSSQLLNISSDVWQVWSYSDSSGLGLLTRWASLSIQTDILSAVYDSEHERSHCCILQLALIPERNADTCVRTLNCNQSKFHIRHDIEHFSCLIQFKRHLERNSIHRSVKVILRCQVEFKFSFFFYFHPCKSHQSHHPPHILQYSISDIK